MVRLDSYAAVGVVVVAPPGWTVVQLGLPLASSIVQLGLLVPGVCSLGTVVVQLGLPTSQLGHYSQLGSFLAVVQLGLFCQALWVVCALM